jgi:ferric-dicitrate binding protein FerR (iron transport regulator)
MELTQKDRVEVAVVTPERVELHVQTGHATFRVAKNPGRSFVTRAAGHTITVFGTVYSVELTLDALEVRVDEGVVEIARDDGSGHWRVRAGERWSGTRRDALVGRSSHGAALEHRLASRAPGTRGVL